MCLLIFKDAGKAFAEAAKKRSMARSVLALAESAVMLAAAMVIMMAKSVPLGTGHLVFAANAFALLIALGIVGGYIIELVANTLGGKGRFYEGLTALSYALVPITAGVLITSILSLLPVLGVVFGMIALTIMVALGLAVLYRGVKDMFRTDMITSFVIISIVTLALIIGLYASIGINIMAGMGRLVPIA